MAKPMRPNVDKLTNRFSNTAPALMRRARLAGSARLCAIACKGTTKIPLNTDERIKEPKNNGVWGLAKNSSDVPNPLPAKVGLGRTTMAPIKMTTPTMPRADNLTASGPHIDQFPNSMTKIEPAIMERVERTSIMMRTLALKFMTLAT